MNRKQLRISYLFPFDVNDDDYELTQDPFETCENFEFHSTRYFEISRSDQLARLNVHKMHLFTLFPSFHRISWHFFFCSEWIHSSRERRQLKFHRICTSKWDKILWKVERNRGMFTHDKTKQSHCWWCFVYSIMLRVSASSYLIHTFLISWNIPSRRLMLRRLWFAVDLEFKCARESARFQLKFESTSKFQILVVVANGKK